MVQAEIQDWPQSKAKLLSSADRIEAIIVNKFSGILESDKKSVELIGQHFPVLIDMNEVGYELAEILTECSGHSTSREFRRETGP